MVEMRPLLRVKQRREELEMSQAELGRLLGVHALTVSRWETGRNFPHRQQWLKLAEVLGVPVSEVLGEITRPAQTEAA